MKIYSFTDGIINLYCIMHQPLGILYKNKDILQQTGW